MLVSGAPVSRLTILDRPDAAERPYMAAPDKNTGPLMVGPHTHLPVGSMPPLRDYRLRSQPGRDRAVLSRSRSGAVLELAGHRTLRLTPVRPEPLRAGRR